MTKRAFPNRPSPHRENGNTGNKASGGSKDHGQFNHENHAQVLIWVYIFLISLFLPINIFLGDIRLSAYRIALIVSIPFIIQSISSPGSEFRKCSIDYLMAAYAILGTISLMATRASISAQGIFLIEAAVPYFLARSQITSLSKFVSAVKVIVYCTIATIPFAIFESLTGNPILITILSKILPTIENVPHEIRLGLDRAQVVFDHPILYGLASSLAFSVAIYASQISTPANRTLGKGFLVGVAAFLSLSSGAFLSVGIQSILIMYDWIFQNKRRRWFILAGGTALILTILELASNRTLAQIVIPYISLNPGTAWTRLGVNTWAMGIISDNPWFGMGFNKNYPPPPYWVPTSSIDNFWLATAFRHGVPTLLALISSISFSLILVAKKDIQDRSLDFVRTAFIVTLTAISIAAITVHFWNAIYCEFLFFLGAGLWLLNEDGGKNASTSEKNDNDSKTPKRRHAPLRRDFR